MPDLENGIYENYGSLADSAKLAASEGAFAAKYFEQQILPHIEENSRKPLIDIGCGYGKYLIELSKHGFVETMGIDISPDQIEIARQMHGLENVMLGEPVSFLKESTHSYGTILLIDIAEHLELEYLIELLSTAYSRLQVGGKILIQTPNALSPLSPLRYSDITHLRAFTPHSIEQLCRAAGAKRPSFYPLPPLSKGVASRLRRFIWKGICSPLIRSYLLTAAGHSMGGIYTPNLLAVIQK